jgi:hypothetical protein
MILLGHIALLAFVGLLPAARHSASVQPIEISLCQVVQNPASFDGKLVRFHAEFRTDHIERSILIDKNCSENGGILPYGAKGEIPGGKAFNDAIGVRNPPTLDETLTMTITGIFHFAQKPEMCMFQNQEQCKRSIAMTRIQDLTLIMTPKR